MSPDEAHARVRALSRSPEPSLVGWQVVTEPDTIHAERWTVYADLPPGLVHEERLLYLRSDSTGEVITSNIESLHDCHVYLTTNHLTLHLRIRHHTMP